MAEERNSSGFMPGFILGALIGVGLGLLLAPGPGQEMRRRLKERGQILRTRADEVAEVAKERVDDLAARANSTEGTGSGSDRGLPLCPVGGRRVDDLSGPA